VQLLPNNHVYNTRIDSLPVNANSSAWIGVTTTPLTLWGISFPINYTSASTPTQNIVFFYTPSNNGSYQIPTFPGTYPTDARIENGWVSATTNQNADHHLLTINTATGALQDMYQYYNAGLNSSCATCTSQGGIKYSASSYALSGGGTSDAAGMYITPATLRLQELENAVATNGSIRHAMRMTLGQGFCASANIWPAQAFANDGGTVPFGARFRLKSSYTKSTYSSVCQTATCESAVQILITQLKQYGLILADGGGSWATQPEYTKWPTQFANALYEISSSGLTPANFEAVDESSLMISASSGLTIANREIITYTSSSGTATTDVVLTGVAVNFPYDLQQIQVGAPAQTFAALVNIGTVTYSMSPSVGTLNSSTGLYTPPASVTTPTAITVTATSNVNASVTASFTLNVFPAGPIRLVPGSVPNPALNYAMIPTTYTDTSSNPWYSIGDDGGYAYDQCNTITGTSNPQLYCRGYSGYISGNDVRFDFIVPNGSYQVTYQASAPAAGTTQDLELNGTDVNTNLDVFASAGGANIAYNFAAPATTVSNNHLSFVQRIVNNAGTNIGSLLIVPQASSTVTLAQNNGVDAGTVTSSSLAFPSNNTAGNWIGVAIRSGANPQTLTVSDSRGSVYRQATQFVQTTDGPTDAIYYAENIAAGANTVTVSQTTSATLRLVITEFSGLAASGSIDVTASSQGSSASPSSGSATTTSNGELLFGLISSANGDTVTPGSGYTSVQKVPASPTTKLAPYGPGQMDLRKLVPYVTLSLPQNEPPRLTSGRRP
jgi:hypothetical protein